MKKTLSLCGAVLLAIPALTLATDYPLEFKTLNAQQAAAFPTSSTTYAMIQGVSQHPLYGQIAAGTNQLLFRLDESKGTGKGYDRLIVDINGNGDLTGDPVVSVVAPPKRPATTNDDKSASRPGTSTNEAMESLIDLDDDDLLFGPIQAPTNFMIGTNRPVFFADVDVFGMPDGFLNSLSDSTSGELSVRPGWYLEATVNVDGKRHKVDLVDAECNFRIGDTERATNYPGANGVPGTWLFEGGDRFMVDWEAPTNSVSSLFDDSSCSFGPILYFGAKPYKAALAADCKSLSVDPWPEPLAELEAAHAGQIAGLELAWEKSPGDWILVKPGFDNGKAKVPPGSYRLYSTFLKAKTASNDFLVMTGTRRVASDTFKALAGATTPVKCGSPLQISLTSTPIATTQPSGFISSLASAILGQSGPSQSIQATLLGAGGETYSTPYFMTDKGGLRTPPAPTFTVLNADGKKVDSGSLEYG
jgi:hypothetical protein